MQTSLSKADVNLARWMADMMIADGVTPEQFLALSDELIPAYGDAIQRKIVKMQCQLLTNPMAAEKFKALAFEVCQK